VRVCVSVCAGRSLPLAKCVWVKDERGAEAWQSFKPLLIRQTKTKLKFILFYSASMAGLAKGACSF